MLLRKLRWVLPGKGGLCQKVTPGFDKGHCVALRTKGQLLSYFYDKKAPVVKIGSTHTKMGGTFSALRASETRKFLTLKYDLFQIWSLNKAEETTHHVHSLNINKCNETKLST